MKVTPSWPRPAITGLRVSPVRGVMAEWRTSVPNCLALRRSVGPIMKCLLIRRGFKDQRCEGKHLLSCLLVILRKRLSHHELSSERSEEAWPTNAVEGFAVGSQLKIPPLQANRRSFVGLTPSSG